MVDFMENDWLADAATSTCVLAVADSPRLVVMLAACCACCDYLPAYREYYTRRMYPRYVIIHTSFFFFFFFVSVQRYDLHTLHSHGSARKSKLHRQARQGMAGYRTRQVDIPTCQQSPTDLKNKNTGHCRLPPSNPAPEICMCP